MNNEKIKTELEEFTKSLEGKTEEELKEIEQEIIKEADALDEELKTMEFKLPAKNREGICDNVCMLLNSQKYQWQYCYSAIAMYDLWKKHPKSVKYPEFDCTLRTLGSMQFEGYDAWKAVVAINDYLDPLREKYTESSEKIYTIADKHNIVIEKLQLFKPVENTEGPEEQ